MDKLFYINWMFRFIFVVIITFLVAGFLYSIVDKIGTIGISLIDHYMNRRQEAIDKMIKDGLTTSKHYN